MESLSNSAYSSSVFVPDRARYIGPFLKGSPQNRKLSPPQIIEERVPVGSFRPRVRIGLTPRVGSRHVGRNHVYSPEPEPLIKAPVRAADDSLSTIANFSMHVQKLSGVSQSPTKGRATDKKKESLVPYRQKNSCHAVSSFDNLTELLNESDITKKYLLIRQSKLQNQQKQKVEMPKSQPHTSSLVNSPYTEKRATSKKKEERKKYQLPPEAQPKPKPPPPRKEEKVSVKEAMRDKEWLSKSRDGIIQAFQTQILQSFGVVLESPIDPAHTGYKFFVGKGNNAQLVKSLFGNRWYWTRVEEEEKETANLIWTQWKEKEWMLGMEKAGDARPQAGPALDASILCSVRYNPSNGPYKQSLTGRAVDLSPLCFDLIFKSASFTKVEGSLNLVPSTVKTHNKLESNHHLANKKALFINMKQYYECLEQDPFAYVPLTFHIKDGEMDPEFQRFEEIFRQVATEAEKEEDPAKKVRNVWILKPGENTNRGTGISVCNTIEQIKEEMKLNPVCPKTGVKRTFILQRYLDRPFLINRRKFDIRLYALVTSANSVLQAYYYSEGYIRTSSKEFSINNISNKLIHLTNDAVQKYSEDYGKFEMANKLSYSDLQRYLDTHYKDRAVNFQQDIAPQLKSIVKDTIQAVYLKIDPCHRAYSFEVVHIQIFGYDFMLDENLKPWLIEVNTNPCLELSSPLLARIIPSMLENAFKCLLLRLAVDPFFPEPVSRRGGMEVLSENKFELIFHELVDGAILQQQLGDKISALAYEDPGLHDLPPDEDIMSEGEDVDGC